MRCDRAREMMSDYSEGALSAALLVPFEHHLGECHACATDLAALRAACSALSVCSDLDPPVGLRALAWSRIDSASVSQTPRRRSVLSFLQRPGSLGWVAAAIVVFALAGVVVPGVRPAGFAWNLFGSRRPAVAVAPTLGAPMLAARPDGGRDVAVTVTNPFSRTLTVSVAVDGAVVGSRTIDEHGAAVVGPVAVQAGSADVRVVWTAGDQSGVIPLKIAK